MIKERQLSNHFGHTRTQFEAVTGLKWLPGFVVYLYLYKNLAFALNPLIWLNFLEVDVTKISRTGQFIPHVLRDTLS